MSKKSLQSFTLIKDIKENIKPERSEKELVPTKTEIVGSMMFLSYKSFGLTIEVSPLKGLMEKSCIMDSNPELYLKMRDNNSMWQNE